MRDPVKRGGVGSKYGHQHIQPPGGHSNFNIFGADENYPNHQSAPAQDDALDAVLDGADAVLRNAGRGHNGARGQRREKDQAADNSRGGKPPSGRKSRSEAAATCISACKRYLVQYLSCGIVIIGDMNNGTIYKFHR